MKIIILHLKKMNTEKWNNYLEFLNEHRDDNETDVHHIVMKSIDPSLVDDPENIVRLSKRDHVTAHRLLAEGVYEDEPDNNYKVVQAYHYICNGNHKNVVSDEEREYASKLRCGVSFPDYVRESLSIGQKGNTNWLGKHHSEESKKKISEHHADFSGDKNPMYGKHFSDESRMKISESMKLNHTDTSGTNNGMYGRKHSDESRKKMSEALKRAHARRKENELRSTL